MASSRQLRGTLEDHLAAFRRGAVELIDERELEKRVRQALADDQPMRIKFGMDPSSPDLHLGHAIPLFKLRDLQALGHRIVLIVGDATAMVGDPSGRSKLRPVLTREQVAANLETYTSQAALVLDLERTEIVRNASWFDGMGFEGILQLTTRMTVAQMIERDTFQERLGAGEPVGINEFLYPLMQGWDSVEVRADVELGGTDQLFNLLVGRRLQEQDSQRPQVIVTTPLVNGLDGRKMSKSYGNAVGLTASAREMTFDLMRLDDESMGTWFLQLTRLPEEQIAELLEGHPRLAKARLAAEISGCFHGAEAAAAAAEAFNREVRDKQLPADIPEVHWDPAFGSTRALANLLKDVGLVQTTSEGRRAVDQGGVRWNAEVQKDPRCEMPEPNEPVLIQVGKKRFTRLLPAAPAES